MRHRRKEAFIETCCDKLACYNVPACKCRSEAEGNAARRTDASDAHECESRSGKQRERIMFLPASAEAKLKAMQRAGQMLVLPASAVSGSGKKHERIMNALIDAEMKRYT